MIKEVVNVYSSDHPIGSGIKEYKDKNSCTVVALSCVTGNTYKQCYDYMKRFGRLHGVGMLGSQIKTAFSAMKKFKMVESPYSHTNRITINQFLKKHPVGKFYCCSRGHAFAIIDGVLYDHTLKLRRQITMSYRFYNKEDLCKLKNKGE